MLHKARQLQRHGLVLAVLLFCAQLAGVLHAHDLEQHLDNTQCQLCIHASHLGHALGGQLPELPAIEFRCIHNAAVTSSCHQAVFSTHYYSRAPPVHA